MFDWHVQAVASGQYPALCGGLDRCSGREDNLNLLCACFRNLEMSVLSASSRTSLSRSLGTVDSVHSCHLPPHGEPAAQALQGVQQKLPSLDLELAGIRVSVAEMPSQMSGRLVRPVGSGHGSTHNNEMVDMLLTNSPREGFDGSIRDSHQ